MKIAIITSEFITEADSWHGGLSNYLSRITFGLKEKGHEIHVFTYSGIREVAEKNGIIIHRITVNTRALEILNNITLGLFRNIFQIFFIAYNFRKYFLSVCGKEKYDVIHSSSCQASGLFLNSKKIGVPMVTRLSSITRLAEIAAGRRNWLDMYLMNIAEKHLARKSDRVFAPSIATIKNAQKEFKLKVDLIEPPEYFTGWDEIKMDLSVYNRYFKNKNYILFYGTLSRLKGSEFIAEIIYDFLNKNKDFSLAIVGKMTPLKRGLAPLEPILKSAGKYRRRIIYTNSLRHEQLIPIIREARAILLPSIIDNLPNTLIESMSLGKVVIGTYDAGFDQLIDNNHNGFLVKFGDKKALLDILSRICDGNKEELTRVGDNAKSTISKRLNYENKIAELENYYCDAIKEFKSKGKFNDR